MSLKSYLDEVAAAPSRRAVFALQLLGAGIVKPAEVRLALGIDRIEDDA